MTEGLVIHDRDGRVIEANAAAAPILGLTHEQLLGRDSIDPRWQAVHEDGTPWPGQDHPAMVALRTGQHQRLQIMGIITPDRGRRWLSINASPLWSDGPDGSSGVPSGAVATFNDVTARLAMKERMEATEAALTDLYDRAPCGYHSLDATGRYARINATELAWLGCTREEVIGRHSPADFFTPEGREIFRQNFPRILAGEGLNGLELELVGRQGQRRRVSVSATPIHGDSGPFVATRSILYDITSLHASRQALSEVNAEQAHLLDNDMVGMAKALDHRFTWVNRGVERIFGYGAGELIGVSTGVLFEDEAGYLSAVAQSHGHRPDGVPFRAQLKMRHKSGHAVWIDLNSLPLSSSGRETLSILVDITPLKIAEDLHAQSVELAAQNNALADSLRLKNQFLSNMSHELRTPLNAVLGLAQLMQVSGYDRGSDKFLRHVGQIEASGRQLLQLIESMLDLARAESGQITLHPETVDLQAQARAVLALLQADSERLGVAVYLTVGPGLQAIWLDPLRLRQVLQNLVGNALKFSHRGGVVDVRAALDGAAQFSIEVQDQGIGIAEADLATLFTPFHQISSGLTRAFEGAGMGLALVRRLVEAQGGHIAVRSVLGEGSTFTVSLPWRPGTTAAVAEPEA